MLSVVDTLKETISVWVRLFRYLVILNFAFLPPDIFLHTLKAYRNSIPSSFWGPPLGFTLDSLQLLFDLASVAALFGLLKNQPLEPKWATVWSSVRNHIWRLFWMLTLIMLISAIPLIGTRALTKYFAGPANADVLLNVVFYFIFFIWALGAPLVSMENLAAKVALKRSWGMVRWKPVYILGCLFIPCLSEWFVRRILTTPTGTTDKELTCIWLLDDFISGFAGSAWGILFWTMCQRIKTAQEQSETIPTRSPPESPSASQTA